MYFECSLAGDLRQVSSLTTLDVERHTRYAVDAAFTDESTKQRLRAVITDWWRREPAPDG